MTATLAVRPRHSHRWIYVVLLVAAVVATVTLSIAGLRGQQQRRAGAAGRCLHARRPARPVRLRGRPPDGVLNRIALPCDRCQGSECLRALAPFRVAQQTGRTIGYGFAAPPWPGWYSKWVWVAPPSAFPLLPVYPTTSPWATSRGPPS